MLSQCQLSGPIPAEISSLQSLIRLELTVNNLSGPIPEEIFNLRNLSVLALGLNSLSGPIPSRIGGMEKLLVLGLSGNEFTGAIPPEIGDLTWVQDISAFSTPEWGTAISAPSTAIPRFPLQTTT